jgi:acyl-CoA thioester hydrolase
MSTPFEHEVTVRYRDLDTYGHVNNAVFATYLEEARTAWIEATLDVDEMAAFSTVLASLDLEFLQPVTARGPLTIEVTVTDVGTSSFTLRYRVRHGDEIVAEGESTQVHIDRETGESKPLPEDWRTQIAAAKTSAD